MKKTFSLALLAICFLAWAGKVEAQALTDAQKVAFAEMELRGFRDLGLGSNLVQRIVHWYRLGNQAQAKFMLEAIYKLSTGKDSNTPEEKHLRRHWVDQFLEEREMGLTE